MPSNMPSVGGIILTILLSNLAGISLAASGGSAGGSSNGGGGGGGGGGDSIDFSGLDGGQREAVVIVIIVFSVVVTLYMVVVCLAGKSIIMIQVALSGEAQSLLNDINQIVRTTSTHSMSGCRQILIGSTLALIRKSEYFISAYTYVERKWTKEKVMDRYKYLSKQEHEKFDIESLVKSIIIQQVIPRADQLPTDYIVVTFLVATNRAQKIPEVRCIKSMEEVLKHLNEIETDELLAVEVLWTPQNENDNLSEQEFLAKYPCLKP